MEEFKNEDLKIVYEFILDRVNGTGDGLAQVIVDLENGDEFVSDRVMDAYNNITDIELLEVLRRLADACLEK